MQVIKNTAALAEFAAELRARPFFAVDTEFMREKTYWPVLCLIQAAADGVEAVIDPLAEGLDLSPFLDAMADPGVIKVFHAARQDVEIFYKLMDVVPTPLFDSQIAAMACGFGDQIGYEPLMRSLLGASIDKGPRFTDWSRRPLSDSQLSYALSDVTHLRDAFVVLQDKLQKTNRLHWVEEEMDALLDPSLYYVAPVDAWRRMKLRGVRGRDVGPIIKLAEWRESEAQKRDTPRSRILKDEAIYELARLQPKTPKELVKARSISSGLERSWMAQAILDAIKSGLDTPRNQLPAIESNRRQDQPPPDVVDLLKVLLKRQCEEFDVAPKLIASAADLEAIALGDDAAVPALKGWRREVFGDAALKLKRGDIALKLSRKRVEIVGDV